MRIFINIIALLYCAQVFAAPLIESDPELTPHYFEGDIVLDNNERSGIRDDDYRWPNKTVYYKFMTEFDDEHRNHILRGMQVIQDVSCIRFKEAEEGSLNFVAITGSPGGCYSSVGWRRAVRQYNLQIYPLDTGCFRLGTVIHEFLHTLGFYHMQSSSNRDEYVRIAEENIQPGTENNFNKYEEDFVDDFDEEYDYGSVMHYSAYAFSVNGEMTIIPLKDDAAGIMGQRRGMSNRDIRRLNVMYRCSKQ